MSIALFPVPHGLDQSKFPIETAGSGYRIKETDEVLSEASSFDVVRCCLIIGIKCEKYTKENAYKNLKKYLDVFGCEFHASNDLDIESADEFPLERTDEGRHILLAETINVRRCGRRPKVVQAAPSMVVFSDASTAQLLECATMLNIDCNDHSKNAVSKAIKDYLRTFRYTFQRDTFVICAENPCMFPDCRFEPVAGCPCCSRALHKRYALLAENRENYRKSDCEEIDPSGCGAKLSKAMMKELVVKKPKNKLQPSAESAKPMASFFEEYFGDQEEKKFSNALELLEFYWPYIHLFKVFIADARSISFYPDQLPSISENDRNVRNQRGRARAMAREWKDRHERFPFMDGHGVVLLFFLHELRKIRNKIVPKSGDRLLKRIKLDWVDINGSVNDWHRIVFPCANVTTHHSDIFDFVKDLLKKKESKNKLLVYFNFCGLAKSFGRLIKFLNESKLAIQFVSFSTARAAKGMDTKFEEALEINFEKVEFSTLADRTDFVTYAIAGLK